MNELFSDWVNGLVPFILIAVGFVLVLVGLIVKARRKRFEVEEQEEPKPSRPRMAPLPRLLSNQRPEQ
ncbi:hypothetical protein ACE10X_13275 [Bradyrhizobium sp. Pha-3]|uniref:hypothetical protein n=1 Tax=Bradyrhizobium sp. Pha-3 TaxID=208375 RepID=UPI0035D4EC52